MATVDKLFHLDYGTIVNKTNYLDYISSFKTIVHKSKRETLEIGKDIYFAVLNDSGIIGSEYPKWCNTALISNTVIYAGESTTNHDCDAVCNTFNIRKADYGSVKGALYGNNYFATNIGSDQYGIVPTFLRQTYDTDKFYRTKEETFMFAFRANNYQENTNRINSTIFTSKGLSISLFLYDENSGYIVINGGIFKDDNPNQAIGVVQNATAHFYADNFIFVMVSLKIEEMFNGQIYTKWTCYINGSVAKTGNFVDNNGNAIRDYNFDEVYFPVYGTITNDDHLIAYYMGYEYGNSDISNARLSMKDLFIATPAHVKRFYDEDEAQYIFKNYIIGNSGGRNVIDSLFYSKLEYFDYKFDTDDMKGLTGISNITPIYEDDNFEIRYQISADNGQTFHYFNGSNWLQTADTSGTDTTTVEDFNNNIASFNLGNDPKLVLRTFIYNPKEIYCINFHGFETTFIYSDSGGGDNGGDDDGSSKIYTKTFDNPDDWEYDDSLIEVKDGKACLKSIERESVVFYQSFNRENQIDDTSFMYPEITKYNEAKTQLGYKCVIDDSKNVISPSSVSVVSNSILVIINGSTIHEELDEPRFVNGEYTFSFWVYPTSFYETFIAFYSSTKYSTFVISTFKNGFAFKAAGIIGRVWEKLHTIGGCSNVILNTFNHIVLTMKQNKGVSLTVKCYLNGVKTSEKVFTKGTLTTETLFYPYKSGGEGFHYRKMGFNGWYDEFLLLEEVLSEEEIQNIYNNPSLAIYSYPKSNPSINLKTSIPTDNIAKLDSFSITSDTLDDITIQVSNDGGASWLYWNGSFWNDALNGETNTVQEVNANIEHLDIPDGAMLNFKFFLHSDGVQQTCIGGFSFTYKAKKTEHRGIQFNVPIYTATRNIGLQYTVIFEGDDGNRGIQFNAFGWKYIDKLDYCGEVQYNKDDRG